MPGILRISKIRELLLRYNLSHFICKYKLKNNKNYIFFHEFVKNIIFQGLSRRIFSLVQ
jgi:hypothetical protein